MLTEHRIGEILNHIGMYENRAVYDAVCRAADESHTEVVQKLASITAGVAMRYCSPSARIRIIMQYCDMCGRRKPCIHYDKAKDAQEKFRPGMTLAEYLGNQRIS